MCSGCAISQKILLRFKKKYCVPPVGAICGFARVFEGGFGKYGAFRWCFCGEVVVNCMVNAVYFVVDFKR
jgi:hypothetical protein